MNQSVIYFILMVLLNNFPLISQEWQVVKNLDSNSNSNMWNYIKSFDSSNVIVVGSDVNGIPRVVISNDAGKSWKYIFNTAIEEYFQDTTLKFYKPYAVHFDKDKIFILAYDYNQKQPYFITSSNFGKNWTIQKTNIAGNDLYFQGNNGIIFGFDRIFYSSNSGVSWLEKPNNISCTGTIEKIRFSSVNKIKILLVDQTNKKAWIYQTEDMAASWQIDTIPYYCRYRSFSFFDDSTGWVIGSYRNGTGDLENDVILKTVDNCKTWQKVVDSAIKDSVSNPFGLFDIDVLSKNEAIAVGSSKRAIYTSDGGLNWQLISKGLENANLLFNAVKFIKPNVVIACGWDNLIARLELSPSTSVVENYKMNNSLIFPNPTTGEIIMKSSNFQQGKLKLELFDLNGNLLKILFDGVYAQGDLRFDISFVVTGIYILKANQNNTVKTFKIIKGK